MYRGGRISCEALQTVTFGTLPETDREVRDILTVWNKAFGTSQIASRNSSSDTAATSLGNDTDTVLLIGSDATETAFKANAPGKRILHLATHGFFANGDCAPGRAGTRSGAGSGTNSSTQPGTHTDTRGIGGLSVDKAPAPRVTSKRAMLQAGLAFAGVNDRATAPSADDGILFAEEIATIVIFAITTVLVALVILLFRLKKKLNSQGWRGKISTIPVAIINT